MPSKNPITCEECDRLASWLTEAIRAYAAAVKCLEETPEGAALERASQEAREAHRLCEEIRTAVIQHQQNSAVCKAPKAWGCSNLG